MGKLRREAAQGIEEENTCVTQEKEMRNIYKVYEYGLVSDCGKDKWNSNLELLHC